MIGLNSRPREETSTDAQPRTKVSAGAQSWARRESFNRGLGPHDRNDVEVLAVDRLRGLASKHLSLWPLAVTVLEGRRHLRGTLAAESRADVVPEAFFDSAALLEVAAGHR